jgi:hypothetical protein
MIPAQTAFMPHMSEQGLLIEAQLRNHLLFIYATLERRPMRGDRKASA